MWLIFYAKTFDKSHFCCNFAAMNREDGMFAPTLINDGANILGLSIPYRM